MNLEKPKKYKGLTAKFKAVNFYFLRHYNARTFCIPKRMGFG
jgi:hypothetical protein